MSAEVTKVGILSCSGEAIPEGTISRLATRRVLELLRPDVQHDPILPHPSRQRRTDRCTRQVRRPVAFWRGAGLSRMLSRSPDR